METSLLNYLLLALLPIFIFTIFLPKFISKKKNLHKKLPPSPPSLPIIGHLHLLKEPLYRTLHNLSNKYGPVFSLACGSRSVLVVSSHSIAEECFTVNDIVFANRPRLLIGKHLDYNYTTLGSSSYGQHWRNLRRIAVVEIFSTTRLNNHTVSRQEEVHSLVKNLFNNSSHGFTKVEMKSKLSELSFNIIMRMVSGRRVDAKAVEDEQAFRELIKEMFELGTMSNAGDFLPILKLFDFSGFEKKLIKLHKKVDMFLQRLVDEQRRKIKDVYQNGGVQSMIETMLSLQESQPSYYSDEIIKGLILVMLNAGTDTTSVTIEWAMSLLLNNLEVLKKARSELDETIGNDKLATEADLGNLPYLHCIINETFRLYPAAPLLVPHESSKDVKIRDYDVPSGTMLLINAWAIHRDPNVWENPTRFIPERFQSEGNDNMVNQLIPFGLGRRACPGASLAKKEVGLILATLIQCFEWESVNHQQVDMSEGTGLTLPKANPLELLCKPRTSMVRALSSL